MALSISLGNWGQFSDTGGQVEQIPFFPPKNLQPLLIIPSDPRLYNQMTFSGGSRLTRPLPTPTPVTCFSVVTW